MTKNQNTILLRIICSTILFGLGLVFSFALPILKDYAVFVFIAAAFLIGFDVILNAFNGVVHGHMLDENFLMTIGSVSAFALGEYAEGTIILLLYQTGELFQSVAVGRSRNSIAELMKICPDEARLENGETVDPFSVSVGDVILVEPGEKIPLDGVVLVGSSSLDTSSLTGESALREVSAGCECISGCINISSPLKIRVTKEFSESTVAKILELVENASSKKAKMENFVRRFAKVYTPAVVISALAISIFPPLFFKASLSVWILRAVMFIVISCPCALVVSVPLSFFGALGAASKKGILVKGSNYLEALGRLDTIIFDKTGTLSQGRFNIAKICPIDTATEEELLMAAAICEAHSFHPIANALKSSAKIPLVDTLHYEVLGGLGIKAEGDNRLLLAGNSKLMLQNGFNPSKTPPETTCVHLADNKYLGYILLEDALKPSSAPAISKLKEAGVSKTVILSGDNRFAVEKVARELGIDDYRYELLPADKVAVAEEIIASSSQTVAFVGDGVNDAPVLAVCDVGIAMGALGSDAAIEAADIVIMNDDLTLIYEAVKISKRAVRICKQNITFSLIIKFSQLVLSLIGLDTIWMAVFADVGVLMLAIANSMRTLKTK